MSLEVIDAFTPHPEQQLAINSVAKGLDNNLRNQTIIGATGTGKTFVMAKIIEKVNRPALILAHNKTLAAQLFREFKEFFPKAAVEYFVSYYDYYQPEAYVAKRDLYIEKDSSINEEIDRMRLKATASLLSRRDTVIVSSVSCIYGLGSPENFKHLYAKIRIGETIVRDDLLRKFIEILYERNDDTLKRGFFRVRGDTIDIIPSYMEKGYRITFFGDEIEAIYLYDPINEKQISPLSEVVVFPAKHFITPPQKMKRALEAIRKELGERIEYFKKQRQILEEERIRSRTLYDLEMLEALGTCAGVENYSRHLSGRKEGEPPDTLIDYFQKDFVLFVDESHVTLPQVRGMHNGDRARKMSLVEHGFRLPSALDNRPLRFDEFSKIPMQTVYVSATPGDYELELSEKKIELINRPTGLLDPEIEVRPISGQIDDLLGEIKRVIKNKMRILITTLTKKMAEDLSNFLLENHISVNYMHSDINAIERVEILQQLRSGDIDVLVGINLLREGLDLPEVALIAILDADKVGFLRSYVSLIQTAGRAARNVDGKVIMYADKMTDAMKKCIDETERRRKLQITYNQKHGIIPKSIEKSVSQILERDNTPEEKNEKSRQSIAPKTKPKEIRAQIKRLDFQMKIYADQMDFEKAIELREKIKQLENTLKKSS